MFLWRGSTSIDIVTACVTSSLIGFHWTLLPTFALVPRLDAAPTWTGYVAFVPWRHKKQQSLLGPNAATSKAPPPGEQHR